MPKRVLHLGIPLILLLTAVWAITMQRQQPPANTNVARLGSISAVVAASGKVAAAEQVDIGPKVGGLVAELLVKEGDVVTAGQVLARLDDQELRARLR